MKTTFSRLFGTTVVILLAALILLGTIFQLLVKNYLTTNTTEELTNDARTIAALAAAYNSDSSLYNPNFLTNLDIAAKIQQSPVNFQISQKLGTFLPGIALQGTAQIPLGICHGRINFFLRRNPVLFIVKAPGFA